MKVIEQCAQCGSAEKTYQVEISKEDRTKFLVFTQELQANFHSRGDPRTGLLFIPPTKYPKQPLVIPSEKENPCTHCEIGRTNAGPGGCNKEDHCMAYMYYMITNIHSMQGKYPQEVSCITSHAIDAKKKKRRHHTRTNKPSKKIHSPKKQASTRKG